MKEFGGADRNRTGDKGFANLCLTTWPRRRVLESLSKDQLRIKVTVVPGMRFELIHPKGTAPSRQRVCQFRHPGSVLIINVFDRKS